MVEPTNNIPQPQQQIPENCVTIILDVYAKQYTLIMSGGFTTILTKDYSFCPSQLTRTLYLALQSLLYILIKL